MTEPITYWEKRVMLNENVLDKVMEVIVQTQPPYVQDNFRQIRNAWQDQIDKLDAGEK